MVNSASARRREIAVVELAHVVDAARPQTVELGDLRDTDGGLIEHTVNTGRPVLIGSDLGDEEKGVGHGRSRYGGPLVPSSPGDRRGGTMRVGFVGLGAMGLPMTRHLLAAGHEVTVASRSRGPIDAAVAAGAREGDGPRGVVADSDVTILCVPNSPEVVEVLDAAMPALGGRQDRRRHLDHRSRCRARAARAGRGHRRALPRRAALGRHRRRRAGNAHAHGRRRRRRARRGPAGARPVRRPHRARRRARAWARS